MVLVLECSLYEFVWVVWSGVEWCSGYVVVV